MSNFLKYRGFFRSITKPNVPLIQPFSKYRGKSHIFNCSCGSCLLSSKSDPSQLANTSTHPKNAEELLQQEQLKNQALEIENQWLRMEVALKTSIPVDSQEDPDIAKLLENNIRWVKAQTVCSSYLNYKIYKTKYKYKHRLKILLFLRESVGSKAPNTYTLGALTVEFPRIKSLDLDPAKFLYIEMLATK